MSAVKDATRPDPGAGKLLAELFGVVPPATIGAHLGRDEVAWQVALGGQDSAPVSTLAPSAHDGGSLAGGSSLAPAGPGNNNNTGLGF